MSTMEANGKPISQEQSLDSLHNALVEGMARGVSNAIETHRRLKQPIVGMRDGRIIWIAPEDIPPRALPGDDLPLPQDQDVEP